MDGDLVHRVAGQDRDDESRRELFPGYHVGHHADPEAGRHASKDARGGEHLQLRPDIDGGYRPVADEAPAFAAETAVAENAVVRRQIGWSARHAAPREIGRPPAWVLPMPGRYVIGVDGVIAYAEVNPDYTRRPDPAELLPVLNRLSIAA